MESGYDPAVWAEMAELGLIGALFSEEAGGFGGAGFDIMVVFEQLGRGLVVEPFLPQLLAGTVLAKCGRTDLIEEVIAGTTLLAFAHGEPRSRYDLAHVETTATRGRRRLRARWRQGRGAGRRCGGPSGRVRAAVGRHHGPRRHRAVSGSSRRGREARLPDGRRLPRRRNPHGRRARSGRRAADGGRHRPHRGGSRAGHRRRVRGGTGRHAGLGRHDARLPQDAQAVRRGHRQVPGARAPHGRHADRDRAGAVHRDQRGRQPGRRDARHLGKRLARLGGQELHRPRGQAGRRGFDPDARRHRHDLGIRRRVTTPSG